MDRKDKNQSGFLATNFFKRTIFVVPVDSAMAVVKMIVTSLEDLRSRLRAYVSENGLRHTPERYSILEVAYNLKKIFTPDDLFDLTRENGLPVSLSTVYNTLTLLERCGIVLRLPSPETKYQYLMASFAEQCPLLFCTECAQFSTYYRRNVKSILADKDLRPPRFSYRQAIICLYGICDKCRKKQSALKKAADKAAPKKKK